MDNYADMLKRVENQYALRLINAYGLVCKQLPFDEASAVLYVAKPHWTNRFDDSRESTVGIFYSVWVTNQLIEQQQFAYNIHSLRLRELPGYKLTSRKFAEEFRKSVRSYVNDWPGIRMDFGPRTLLEGREQCDAEMFESKVARRIDAFVKVHTLIDRLLKKYTVS